jgi:hypothetical protein
MRFPDHSVLGTITIDGIGEFRVSMDRIVPVFGAERIEYIRCGSGSHWHAFQSGPHDNYLPFEGPTFASKAEAQRAVLDYAETIR